MFGASWIRVFDAMGVGKLCVSPSPNALQHICMISPVANSRLARLPKCLYLGAMTKNATTMTSRPGRSGQYVPAPSRARGSKVKFGSVTVSGTKPTDEAIQTNVERSTQALARVTKKLATPGIPLREKKDVPQFSVAEGETGIFIRRLNGRTDRGRFLDGGFKVTE